MGPPLKLLAGFGVLGLGEKRWRGSPPAVPFRSIRDGRMLRGEEGGMFRFLLSGVLSETGGNRKGDEGGGALL